jgi:hypothetical protein
MARAIMASGLLNPKAIRVRRRILVFVLDQAVGQPVFEGGVDGLSMSGDPAPELHEGWDAAASGPAQPPLEQRLAFVALEREDLPELLFEQVGPEQLVVDLRDPGLCRGRDYAEAASVRRPVRLGPVVFEVVVG